MNEQKLGDDENQEHKTSIAKVKRIRKWSSVPASVCETVRTIEQLY